MKEIMKEVSLSNEEFQWSKTINKRTFMKEPKVQVGICFEPQIEFILNGQYVINGIHVTGRQVATYDENQILWQGRLYNELIFERHRNKRARSTWLM